MSKDENFNNYNNELVILFKEWKKGSHMTLEEIASIIGCSKGHLCGFLKGNVNISYNLGKKIEFCINKKLCKKIISEVENKW